MSDKIWLRKIGSDHNTLNVYLPIKILDFGYTKGNYVKIRVDEKDQSIKIERLDLS